MLVGYGHRHSNDFFLHYICASTVVPASWAHTALWMCCNYNRVVMSGLHCAQDELYLLYCVSCPQLEILRREYFSPNNMLVSNPAFVSCLCFRRAHSPFPGLGERGYELQDK